MGRGGLYAPAGHAYKARMTRFAAIIARITGPARHL